MNRTTLRTIRTGFDLTHDTMARRINVAKDTLARREGNELAIREPMAHVIQYLWLCNTW